MLLIPFLENFLLGEKYKKASLALPGECQCQHCCLSSPCPPASEDRLQMKLFRYVALAWTP